MNRSHTLKASAILVGALAFGALAAAQNGGGGQNHGNRGGFGGGRSNSLFMLRRSDVQSDLQLTTDQKSKIQDIFDSMRGQRGNRGKGDAQSGTPPTDAERQARRAQMESQRAEMESNVNGILTSSQIKRLKEISIQTRGNMALMDSDVQKQLDLSSDQKDKIKSLREKMSEAGQSIFQKMQDNSITRDDAMKSLQKNNEVMKDELAKILTRSQSEKLKDLGGAPFKADPSESQGFGGFGRGGGRGRRGGQGGAGGTGGGGGLQG